MNSGLKRNEIVICNGHRLYQNALQVIKVSFLCKTVVSVTYIYTEYYTYMWIGS